MVQDDDEMESFMNNFIRDQPFTTDSKLLTNDDLDNLDLDQLNFDNIEGMLEYGDEIDLDEYSMYLQKNMEQELDRLDFSGYSDGGENMMERNDDPLEIGYLDNDPQQWQTEHHSFQNDSPSLQNSTSLGNPLELQFNNNNNPTNEGPNEFKNSLSEFHSNKNASNDSQSDLVNINSNLTQRLKDSQQQLSILESRLKKEFEIELLKTRQEMLSRKEDALFKLQLEFKKEKQELIDQYQRKSKNSEFEDEIKALLMPFSKTSIPNDKDILETAKLMVEHVQSLSEKLLQYEEKISALQNASNELELKMNDYEIENRKLVEEKNGMEMENLKLKREIEEIKVEKDQFQSSAGSNQRDESRINDLQSQVHSQQDQIQSLEQQNEILESQIASLKIEPQTIQDLTNKYPSITSKFLSQADKKYEKMLKFHQDEYLRQLDQERQHTEKTCQVLKQECKSAYDNAMSQLLAAFKEKESQVLTKLQTKYKSRINELGNQIQKLNDQELNLNNEIKSLKLYCKNLKQKYIDTLKSMRTQVEKSKLDQHKSLELEWNKRKEHLKIDWDKKVLALKEHCFSRHSGCSRCLSILAIRN